MLWRHSGLRISDPLPAFVGWRIQPGGKYPKIVRDSKGMVQGKLLDHIDESSLRKLDEYEDDETVPYRRIKVRVTIETGERVKAEAYVPKNTAIEYNRRESGRILLLCRQVWVFVSWMLHLIVGCDKTDITPSGKMEEFQDKSKSSLTSVTFVLLFNSAFAPILLQKILLGEAQNAVPIPCFHRNCGDPRIRH